MNKFSREEVLVESDCEVLEQYKNKIIVKTSHDDCKSVVALKVEKISGQKVDLYKRNVFSKAGEIFLYISPLYCFLLGFVLGFLFKNSLYHFLLIIGTTILGLGILFLLKFLFKKNLPYKFIVKSAKKTS